MLNEQLLQTSAIVSVAMADFSGLISALARFDLPAEACLHRVRSMLEACLFALVFSLLPLLPVAFGVSEETTWRLSSALLGLGFFAFLAVMGRDLHGLVQATLLPEDCCGCRPSSCAWPASWR